MIEPNFTLDEFCALIRCDPWWVKEQCRLRKLSHSRVGRKIQFTPDQARANIASFAVEIEEPLPERTGITARSLARQRSS